MTLNIPSVLKPYQGKVLATLKPVIHITLSPADDLPLWAGKVGGKPYLPKGLEYLCDKRGNPLALLAQFNMADLPENDSLPKVGILSFFISGFDGQYGRNLDDGCKPDNFRVLYFNDVIMDNNALWQDFNDIDKTVRHFDELFLPFNYGDEFAMQFKLADQEISHTHYDFADELFDRQLLWEDILQDDDDKWYAIVERQRLFSADGHHLLGHAHFLYDDPRAHHLDLQDYVLLWQLDSDDDLEVFWGDCGIAQFLIHPDDLAKLDFAHVHYDWNCS